MICAFTTGIFHETKTQFQHKTFHVVHRNLPAAFTIDWTDGFLLKPFASPGYSFIYSFSQLKSSSDDGSARLTLCFQEGGRGGDQQGQLVQQVNARFNLHCIKNCVSVTRRVIFQWITIYDQVTLNFVCARNRVPVCIWGITMQTMNNVSKLYTI